MSRIIVNGNQYDRFNIGKLSRSGQNTQSSSSVQILNSSKTNNTTNVTTNVEGHYIWGNYYDATQDIEGSLSNVQDINMSGDINMTLGSSIMQWREDEYSYIGPDTYAYLGHIKTPSITSDLVDAILADIDLLESDNIANANKITTKDLEATNKIVSPYAEITDLYSEDIRTHNLTVTGSAHFFELVIDKIKAAGGSFLLTPADGFKIYYHENINIQGERRMVLYFVATDDEGNAISNMWQIGDFALIQDFNRAVAGETMYDVDNTYFWSLVKNVSSQPGTYIVREDEQGEEYVDPTIVHYIELSLSNNEYDGAPTVYDGADVAMLGNNTNPARQTAIYMSCYNGESGNGTYDEDLLAPFVVYYEGVNPLSNKGFNLSEYKVQWWSSGVTSHGAQNNIPQNRMVGSFLLSAGKTIEQYIDENIKDADINIITLDYGTDIWMINANPNYSIVTPAAPLTDYQQWNTSVKVKHNGNDWWFETTSVSAYILTANNTGTIETPLSSNEYWFTFDDIQLGGALAGIINIGLNSQTLLANHFNGWDDSTSRTIRFRFTTILDEQGTQFTTKDLDVQCVKLARGENGSATQVAMVQYSLVPEEEKAYVDASGAMIFRALYHLKRVYTDSNGNTLINTIASIPNGYTMKFSDDASIRYKQSFNISNDTFIISLNDLLLNGYFYNTQYNDYIEAMEDDSAPNYITVYLYDDNNNVIDQKVVQVQFLTGSVFDVADDKITLAVAGSQSYVMGELGNQITTVNNQISSLNIKANGIQSNVNSLTTQVNGMQGEITTKADKSYVDQTASSITSTVTSQISGVQGEIASLGNNVAQNYVLTSSIAQTAENIKLTVEQDINGQLSETGIDIENKKITLNADNTNINGNLNINDPEVGLILYDVYDNPRIVIQNNELGDFEDFDFGADKRTSGNGFIRDNLQYKTITINNISLGNFTNGQSIRLHNWKIGGSFTTGPQTNIDTINYTFNIKKGSATIHTLTGTLDSSDISGITYNVPEYTFEATTGSYDYYIDATLIYNLRNINEGAEFNGYTTLYVESKQSQLNKIALDGAVFASDNEHYNWFGSDKTILRDGISEIRFENGNILRNSRDLRSSSYNQNFSDISSTVPTTVSSSQSYKATMNDCMIMLRGGASGRKYVYLPDPYMCGGKMYIIKNMDSADCRVSCVNESECMVSATSNSVSEYEQIKDDTTMFIACGQFWIRVTMKQD